MASNWQILGVKAFATDAEIQARYRNLAKTQHPDVGGDPEAWQRVTVAYNDLRAGKTIADGDDPHSQEVKHKIARLKRQMQEELQKMRLVEARIVTWDKVSAAKIIGQMKKPIEDAIKRIQDEISALSA